MKNYRIECDGEIIFDLDVYAQYHGISREEAAKRAFPLLVNTNREIKRSSFLQMIGNAQGQSTFSKILDGSI